VKGVELHYFPDSATIGRRIARSLGVPAHGVKLHRFPDGESLVRLPRASASHAVLVRLLHAPNTKIFEVLLAADALRRNGARRVTLIAPYLPYMRQDAVFRTGEPLSQQVLADSLGRAVDDLVTLEAHLHRTPRLADVFACRARSLDAAPLIAAWSRKGRRSAVVVGPDSESEPWVRAVGSAAGLPWVVAAKERLGDRRVRISLPEVPSAARAILVDDIASSGATLAVAARALHRRGFSRVDAAVVHAVFAGGALGRIRRAGVERLVSCDTIPHETNAIATAEHFAEAVRAIAARRPRRRNGK
jgi:ribose-phosphate pyrophosphokinase